MNYLSQSFAEYNQAREKEMPQKEQEWDTFEKASPGTCHDNKKTSSPCGRIHGLDAILNAIVIIY